MLGKKGWETYLSWNTILAFAFEASAADEAAAPRLLHDVVSCSMPDTCCILTHGIPLNETLLNY